MSAPYDFNLMRLAVNVRSNPPMPVVDQLTGEAPSIWRGASTRIQLGIFDIYGAGADLSNLSYLQFAISPAPIGNQRVTTNYDYAQYSFNPYPTTPPAPLLFVTVPASSIESPITLEGWEEGVEQNCSIDLEWVDTQALNLGGQSCKRFVYSIIGFAEQAGSPFSTKINYGGGFLEVFESGTEGIYLPNTVAPLDVPDGTILYVQPNQQLLFSETISVEGTIRVDGVMIQVPAIP